MELQLDCHCVPVRFVENWDSTVHIFHFALHLYDYVLKVAIRDRFSESFSSRYHFIPITKISSLSA